MLCSMDDEKLHFRRLQPDDKVAVQLLCKECFPVSYPDTWYDDITTNPKYYTQAGIDSNGSIVALLVAEEKCLIHCKKEEDISILPRWYPYETRVAYILSLGVSAKYRRKGTARQLVIDMVRTLMLSPMEGYENHVVNIDSSPDPTFRLLSMQLYASNHNNASETHKDESGWSDSRVQDPTNPCKAIYLHVLWSNRAAIRLYEQIGFRLHCRLQDYYFISGSTQDAYLYVLYLNGGEPPPSFLEMTIRGLNYCYETAPLRCARNFISHSFHSTVWLLYSLVRTPFIYISALVCKLVPSGRLQFTDSSHLH